MLYSLKIYYIPWPSGFMAFEGYLIVAVWTHSMVVMSLVVFVVVNLMLMRVVASDMTFRCCSRSVLVRNSPIVYTVTLLMSVLLLVRGLLFIYDIVCSSVG